MNPIQTTLVFAVRVYRRVLSPLKTAVFGPAGRCRFTPTCSEYAVQALRAHGALRGSWISLRRVCRCHPWGGCGDDPVPEVRLRLSSPEQAGHVADPGFPLSADSRQHR